MKKVKTIEEQLASYEDACKLLKRTPLTLEQFNFMPEAERKVAYSQHRINTGIEAINEGHVFNWDDYNEYKHFPVWDMETYGDAVPGSGFALVVAAYGNAGTHVGARLVTRSEAHTRHICTVFFEDYRNVIKK